MSDAHARCLREIGLALRELAPVAKHEATTVSGEQAAWARGRAFSVWELILMLQLQAKSLGIPLEEIGLDGVDPDSELLAS